MRFFDFFLRRIDGRRKASPGPDPCGALPTGREKGNEVSRSSEQLMTAPSPAGTVPPAPARL